MLNSNHFLFQIRSDIPVFVLGAGTGDTFNALIHSEKTLRNMRYGLIVRKTHYDLVETILNNFLSKPEIIYVCDDEVILNKWATSGGVGVYRGPVPKYINPGLYILWADPSDWDYCNSLTVEDQIRWQTYFSSIKTSIDLPSMAFIFFTSAVTHQGTSIDFKFFANHLLSLGVSRDLIFINSAANSHLYGDEEIHGFKTLLLSHKDIIGNVYRLAGRVMLIGVRSGMFDIMRFSESFAYVSHDLNFIRNTPGWRMMVLKNNYHLYEDIVSSDFEDPIFLDKINSMVNAFYIFNTKNSRFSI